MRLAAKTGRRVVLVEGVECRHCKQTAAVTRLWTKQLLEFVAAQREATFNVLDFVGLSRVSFQYAEYKAACG